jgi:hypothetical protein
VENIAAQLILHYQREIVRLDIIASHRLPWLHLKMESLEIYALLAAIVQQVQHSQLFVPQVLSIHQQENLFYQIVSNAQLDHSARQQDFLPRQQPALKVSFVQVAINRLTTIYVPSDSIVLLAHQIRLHAVVQTSIKTCKVNQLVSILVQKDISALIVQGHNVSRRKANYPSIVMAPRKLQSIVMLELIIQ